MALEIAATHVASPRETVSRVERASAAAETREAADETGTTRVARTEEGEGKRGEESGLRERGEESPAETRRPDPEGRGRILDLAV